MTTFDTIFQDCARKSGFSWVFAYGQKDKNIITDRNITDYPCILRTFNEPLQPLFDPQRRVSRDLSLYIIHIGFKQVSSEDINANLEQIMFSFMDFRNLLRSKGIECNLTQKPFPNWQNLDCDEYGYVFNITCTYSLCLN